MKITRRKRWEGWTDWTKSTDFFPASVAVVCLLLVLVVMTTDPPAKEVSLTDSELCEAFVIEWSGYTACWKETSCQLGNEEMFEMYQLNKAATMACERAITRNRLYVPPLLPQEVL